MRWRGEVSSLKGAEERWSEPRPLAALRAVIGSGPFPPAPLGGLRGEPTLRGLLIG